MRHSKFSDGIEKVEGKSFQKSYIKTTYEFYVNCPYCGETTDLSPNDQLMKCSICKKEFFAEIDSTQLI